MLIECNQIPNDREEISTPEYALAQLYLSHLADFFPLLDNDGKIMLLLERNILRAAQWMFFMRTDLGWVIIGIWFPYNTQASGDVNSHTIIIHGCQVYLGELPIHILSNTTLQTTNNSSKPVSSTDNQESTNTEILHNIDVPNFVHHVTSKLRFS